VVAPAREPRVEVSRIDALGDEVDAAAARPGQRVLEQVQLAGVLHPGRPVRGAAVRAPPQADVALARGSAAWISGVEGGEGEVRTSDRLHAQHPPGAGARSRRG
jgi:hypothetical protein